jgi:hypothetical protein
VLPLHLSFIGLSGAVLKDRDDEIRHHIESHSQSTYTLVSKTFHGGTALLVYAKDSSISHRIRDVRVSRVGLGPLYMVNKAAVGVRMSVDNGYGGESTFTFVCAHLAAHSYNLERRNDDWRSIVSQLVFSTPSGALKQIYDTLYLFVFGDLNYRVTYDEPDLGSVVRRLESDLGSLLFHDQLRIEHAAGRTLHHLREGPITFKPSYKFEQGSVDAYNMRKRLPSWCDRIFFATWADRQEPEEGGESPRAGQQERRQKLPRVELYRSIMSFTLSDHKPVTTTAILCSPEIGPDIIIVLF